MGTDRLGLSFRARSGRDGVDLYVFSDTVNYTPARGNVEAYIRECVREWITEQRAINREYWRKYGHINTDIPGNRPPTNVPMGVGYWADNPLQICVLRDCFYRGQYHVSVYYSPTDSDN